MDSITITDIIIFAVLMAILWNVLDMKREQRETTKILNIVTDALKEVTAYVDHGNEKEMNTIQAINEMCKALNQSFSTTGAFMNHTSYTLQNIAVCMISFIDSIKQRAVANEEYEKAQECANIINNLKEIIKPKSNN